MDCPRINGPGLRVRIPELSLQQLSTRCIEAAQILHNRCVGTTELRAAGASS